MTAPCPLDLNTRRVIESDRLGQLLRCGWCGQYERVEYEPTVQNDLNREWQ